MIIELMKLSEILTPSFKPRRRDSLVVPTVDSDFCHEAVARGWLTVEQMRRAARRYRLGRSRSGRTIFWMIDESGFVRDGHIGHAWASQMLKQREPELLKNMHTEHCLFGLHLLSETQIASNCPQISSSVKNVAEERPACIVEKERSAVVLSELFPKQVWLAVSYLQNFTIDRLEPLTGHRITLFPATDPMMNTYVSWLDIADQARRAYQLDITVSSLLEDKATSEQKMRCIDLAEFILE